jgi:hypothetical protein
MKNILFALILLLFACNSGTKKQGEAASASLTVSSAPVTIYYFHLTNRCPTCKSVEANILSMIDKYYSEDVKNGRLVFKSINVDAPENRKVSEKFKAFGSALHVVVNKDGSETDTDLTNMAFSYSLRQPDVFIATLRSSITPFL